MLPARLASTLRDWSDEDRIVSIFERVVSSPSLTCCKRTPSMSRSVVANWSASKRISSKVTPIFSRSKTTWVTSILPASSGPSAVDNASAAWAAPRSSESNVAAICLIAVRALSPAVAVSSRPLAASLPAFCAALEKSRNPLMASDESTSTS